MSDTVPLRLAQPAVFALAPMVGYLLIGGVQATQEVTGNSTVLGTIIAGAFALAIAALPYLSRWRNGRGQTREQTVPKSAYDLLFTRVGELEVEVAALRAELDARPPVVRRR